VAGKIEKATYEGIPEDEIFIYEDALRKGRSVVVALTDDVPSASIVRDVLKKCGAESIDAAREQWWTGLRSAEKSHYTANGGNFDNEEIFYRLGFEAALHARTRCMEFDQVSSEMDAALEETQRRHPGANVEEPFTRGYQRGREYYQHLCDESNQAA
jgi:hypothetical protein